MLKLTGTFSFEAIFYLIVAAGVVGGGVVGGGEGGDVNAAIALWI